jgi:hypothetical protein
MNHYVYKLYFINGMKYIGVHSTPNVPEEDVCYLGSGRELPPRSRHTCTKVIIGTYLTRDEAIQAEQDHIQAFNCVESDDYYNKRLVTYDRYGKHTIETCVGTALSAAILAGRTKDTHEYLRAKGEKFKQYAGAMRTPALKAADKIRGLKVRGTKDPRKGKGGVKNNGFNPWYYITPAGDYHEVHDVTKQEFAPRLGVTPRQLGHRFHYTNMHKVAPARSPLKGWTFGDLPRPTDTSIE